jgi:hypothetical protein
MEWLGQLLNIGKGDNEKLIKHTTQNSALVGWQTSFREKIKKLCALCAFARVNKNLCVLCAPASGRQVCERKIKPNDRKRNSKNISQHIL